METLNQLLKYLPSGYTKYVLLLMLLGRAYYALRNGGGIKGIWKSILFGTNIPKDIKTPSSNGPSEPRP